MPASFFGEAIIDDIRRSRKARISWDWIGHGVVKAAKRQRTESDRSELIIVA